MVEKTYGHKALYLFAEEHQEIVGILPLFMVDSRIFGKRLVSSPYGPYGGCSAKTDNATSALIRESIELCRSHHVKYLELRNMEEIPDMPTNHEHVTMFLNLSQGEEAVWSNLRKGMKACVKRAAKESFKVTLRSREIDDFYSIYRGRMHELGTPVPPFSFFRNILECFPEAEVATIKCQGDILASQVLLHFKGTVIYGWGASSKRYSEAHPTHLLLWNVIQDSIARGYKIFDFGRSARHSGTFDFKRWWGAEPQPLYYQYHLNRGSDIPFIHPSNPKYSVAIRIWRGMPLLVANRIGPFLSREFP